MCKNVLELLAPGDQVEALKAEAENLPKLNITLLDCQWVQVSVSIFAALSPLNAHLGY